MEVHAHGSRLQNDKPGLRASADSRLERLCHNFTKAMILSFARPFTLRSITMKLAIISSAVALSWVWLVSTSHAVGVRSRDKPPESTANELVAKASIPIRSLNAEKGNFTYEAYNSQCRSALCGEALDKVKVDPIKKPEGFKCCIGSASSLVLKWHAPCAGNISIVASPEQSSDDCGLRVQDPDMYRLVDCACYRRLLNPSARPTSFVDDEPCQLSHSTELSSSTGPIENDSYEVCLVSVDFDAEGARRLINWSQPLPSTIGLQHSSVDRTTRTYFETSCASEWLERSYFGKWTNSCPRMGYTNAKSERRRRSTATLNGLVYAELIDGTSTDLMPNWSAATRWFDPTFAGCSCVKQKEDLPCGDSLISPTVAPSTRFGRSTILPTRQFHGGEMNESTRQPMSELHIPSCSPVLEVRNETIFPSPLAAQPGSDPSHFQNPSSENSPPSIYPSSESVNRPRTPSPFVVVHPNLQARPSIHVDHLTLAPSKIPPHVQSVSNAPSATAKPRLLPKPSPRSFSGDPSPRPKADESLPPSWPACTPFVRHQRPTRSIGPIAAPRRPTFPDVTIRPSGKPVVATTEEPSHEFSTEGSQRPHASSLHPSAHALTFEPKGSPSRIPTTTPSNSFSSSETARPSKMTAKPSSSLVSSPSFVPTDPADESLSTRPSQETSQLPTRRPSYRHTLHPSIGSSEQATLHPTSGTHPPMQVTTTPAIPASSRSPSGVSVPRPVPPATHLPLPRSSQPEIGKAPSMDPQIAPQVPTLSLTRGPSGTPPVSATIFPTTRRTLLPTPSVVSTLVPVELPTSVPSSSSQTRVPIQAPAPSPKLSPASSTKPTDDVSRYAPTHVPFSIATFSPSPTDFPSAGLSLEPTAFQSEIPTDAPFVSFMPSSSVRSPMSLPPPTLEPRQRATLLPSPVPTQMPSEHLTVAPTVNPTSVAVSAPTLVPNQLATLLPTPGPTDMASVDRTGAPTQSETSAPVPAPTPVPNQRVTLSPTTVPTHAASGNPTVTPTQSPTSMPVRAPTLEPKQGATLSPTIVPTRTPSGNPTDIPSQPPTTASAPTLEPSLDATPIPTETPTYSPSTSPTEGPSFSPTPNPTVRPSSTPTQEPTQLPTESPTQTPTLGPTQSPTPIPSSVPTPASWPEPVVVPGSECTRYQFSNCFFVASRNCHSVDSSVGNGRCYFPGPNGRRGLFAADEEIVTITEVLSRFELGTITKEQIRAELSRHELLAQSTSYSINRNI
jgi:hypothetical protein